MYTHVAQPRPLENLSRRQRQGTPPAFAMYLIARVRTKFLATRIACLWTMARSSYHLLAGLDCWGEDRNALLFKGPGPIIAHPPCGCWGKYKKNCFHSRDHGVAAMRFVHIHGGVVEQPVGSSLFTEHGRPGANIEKINQGDFGHLSLKPTLLYWWPRT